MKLQKPMLAGTVTDVKKLRFPLLASPKLDGVRAFAFADQVVSRTFKPIPNKRVQRLFAQAEFDGLDGELIVGDPTAPDAYRKTMSGVMAEDGEPEVRLWVFDYHKEGGPFVDRLKRAHARCRGLVVPVPHITLYNLEELEQLEELYLSQGYEGVMLRSLTGPYKCGRSTESEGWLLKLKRFQDSEAMVLSVQELMTNTNEAETSLTGHTVRSSKKAGMVGRGTMGALHVKDLLTGVEFDLGTGFNEADRAWWWARQHATDGLVVKYKFFPSGSKDKPRFPTYLGLRDVRDR